MLPDPEGRLAAKTSRISACSLHTDTSYTLAPDSAGDQAVCLVCRGTLLEILSVPSLEPLLSFSSASAGLPVMDGSEGGMALCLNLSQGDWGSAGTLFPSHLIFYLGGATRPRKLDF